MARSRSPAPASSRKRSSRTSINTQQEEKENKSKKHHQVEFEFGGPIGAMLIPILLPNVIYFLYFAASEKYQANIFPTFNLFEVFDHISFDWFSVEGLLWSMLALIAWFIFLVFLWAFLPGDEIEGTKLRNGQVLLYKCNAHLSLWVVLCVAFFGNLEFKENGQVIPGPFPLDKIYDNFLILATASMVLCTILSVYLYVSSFSNGNRKLLALGGDTGVAIYDFFIGRELNPRIGSFDWKEFCELRPGLIGWLLVNFGCAMKQYKLYGSISTPMLLVNLFQLLYVWDGIYAEKSILSTMDITTDGFGFMLVFGDMAWVPFTYSVQSRYLVTSNAVLTPQMTAFIVALNFLGYVIFRGSNSEKDAFRKDPSHPSVAHLKYIETKSGSKLIVSGWWGLARKINYTGDWFMAVSWSLTTGFVTPVTYFYPIYFAILLIHRAMRDDHACAMKYGEDWPKYKARVPYVFFPGII